MNKKITDFDAYVSQYAAGLDLSSEANINDVYAYVLGSGDNQKAAELAKKMPKKRAALYYEAIAHALDGKQESARALLQQAADEGMPPACILLNPNPKGMDAWQKNVGVCMSVKYLPFLAEFYALHNSYPVVSSADKANVGNELDLVKKVWTDNYNQYLNEISQLETTWEERQRMADSKSFWKKYNSLSLKYITYVWMLIMLIWTIVGWCTVEDAVSNFFVSLTALFAALVLITRLNVYYILKDRATENPVINIILSITDFVWVGSVAGMALAACYQNTVFGSQSGVGGAWIVTTLMGCLLIKLFKVLIARRNGGSFVRCWLQLGIASDIASKKRVVFGLGKLKGNPFSIAIARILGTFVVGFLVVTMFETKGEDARNTDDVTETETTAAESAPAPEIEPVSTPAEEPAPIVEPTPAPTPAEEPAPIMEPTPAPTPAEEPAPIPPLTPAAEPAPAEVPTPAPAETPETVVSTESTTAKLGVSAEALEKLTPLYNRLARLKCKEEYSALCQKRLLLLLDNIRNGGNINAPLPETKGSNALHYSCALCSLSITTWLLENGADPNAKTAKGANPLTCVGDESNRNAIISVLKKHGARAAENHAATESIPEEEDVTEEGDDSSFDGLELHISRIENMSVTGSNNRLYKKRLLTLLPMIKEGKGVNVSIPESKGNTPLHYACAIGDVELVRWLLEHGADTNAKTSKGKTPRQNIGKNKTTITKLLQEFGGK